MSYTDFIDREFEVHQIFDDYEIYAGMNNPWKDIIKEQKLYENNGVFQYIAHENIPKVIAIYKKNNRIVSYLMIFKDSKHFKTDNYIYANYSTLGTIGAWTDPEYRGQKIINKLSLIMTQYFSECIGKRVYPYKPMLLFCCATITAKQLLKNFTACDIRNIHE